MSTVLERAVRRAAVTRAVVVDPNAQPEDKVVLAGQGCPTQAITIMRGTEKLV